MAGYPRIASVSTEPPPPGPGAAAVILHGRRGRGRAEEGGEGSEQDEFSRRGLVWTFCSVGVRGSVV